MSASDRMKGRATREAALPGEPFVFEVSPGSGCTDEDVVWSGGGIPATGVGRRFTTAFPVGGTHTVTAACGGLTARFHVTVCPVDEWLARAREFYGPSIDLSRVRVRTSRAVLGAPGTAWTCNTVIRFKLSKRAEDLPRESTLIHELVHVWEHQSGQAQLVPGFLEQIGRLFGRDPYDFGGPERLRNARTLRQFNKESQAQIVTELWRSVSGSTADRKGIPFSTPGYVEDLRRLVDEARIGVEAGHRRTLASTLDAAVARVVNTVLG
jgi:hypothetical protein